MIYLDNAATTLAKPQAVGRYMTSALNRCGSAGRGGHEASMNAARIILECREEAALLFGLEDPERIVFTLNATHALNIAIKSVLGQGGTALVSGFEHNAVMRPLFELSSRGVRARIAHTPLFEPEMAVHSFEQAMDGEVACVICAHVSNVFGYILPLARIDELCAARGLPLIVDASQSAGTVPLNISEFKSRCFFCMPGHKGLFGPQGTGILICPEGGQISTLIEGGTGSNSAELDMPDFLPDRLESGTHNTPGIAGLRQGIKYVRKTGVNAIAAYGKELVGILISQLSGLPGIRMYASRHMFCQSGLLSLIVRDMDSELAAERLAKEGIAVRAGLHCSPMAHKTAGTYPAGTVRLSVSAFSARGDVRMAAKVLRKISES